MSTYYSKPLVKLIATTGLDEDHYGWIFDHMDSDIGNEAESLIEFAGRTCYRSYHRPNPETASAEAYIDATVHDKKHFSILEHASATFQLTGVSRSLLAEITRHRHLSFSVESQRFVNSKNADFVVPPAVEYQGIPAKAAEILVRHAEASKQAYKDLQTALSDEKVGLSRKQINEAARAVMPNMTATTIIVTGNFRTWLEVLERRTAEDVDAEFHGVALQILQLLDTVAPAVFGKLADERMKGMSRLAEVGISGPAYSHSAKQVVGKLSTNSALPDDSAVNTQVKGNPGPLHRSASKAAAWNAEAGHMSVLPGNRVKDWKNPETRQLAARIFKEEADEFVRAILEDNVEETLDGAADVLFTLFGALAKADLLGEIDEAYNEVCKSNNTKLPTPDSPAVIEKDGKIGKPKHYKKPNLRFLVERVRKRQRNA